MALTDWLGNIKKWFAKDKEAQVAELAHGHQVHPYVENPQNGYLDFPDSGNGALTTVASSLHLDYSLMQKYKDYEDMDDYPELSCLGGDSLVFVLDRGWVPIRELAERGGEFWVMAYDRELRALVPAPAKNARCTGPVWHAKRMVRVVFDDGRFIDCTADHKFMTKDGGWKEAGDLMRATRVMPGVLRMRPLNTDAMGCYWEVHQPHADSRIVSTDGKRWTWIHRLVGERIHGAKIDEIVHHKNGDKLDNDPRNLTVEDRVSHAKQHIAGIDNSQYFPVWDDDRRAKMAEKMRGNRYRRGCKATDEQRAKMSVARKGRVVGPELRQRISLGQPNRIEIPCEKLEAALREGGSVANAAKILGVSWSKVKRDAVKHDLLAAHANHRVLRVEELPTRDAVYDLEVPGYHNFVCNGVVVHNSALDVMADDSTIPDSVSQRTLWASAKDNVVRGVIEDLFVRRLRVEDDIHTLSRCLAKYGDAYGEILATKEGVVGINYLPPATIRRIQDHKGALLGYIQSPIMQFQITQDEFDAALKIPRDRRTPVRGCIVFEPWEIVHWRLRSKNMRSPYGVSLIDSARWIWKRLMMLEDSELVSKLTRAPNRFAFYVDTGDLPPQEAYAHVKRIQREYQKKKLINPATGQLDFRFNVLCLAGDTRVQLLNGTSKTLVEMGEAFDRGEEQWVYSTDLKRNGKFVPGKVVWAGKTRRNAELVKVTLDNGETVRLTPDHRCIRRNGETVEAQALLPGDSLMPFRRKPAEHEWKHPRGKYEHVYDPATRKYVLTHQVVARECGMLAEGQVVHHRNGRDDNQPSSLACMTIGEHTREHAARGDGGGQATARKRLQDPVLHARLCAVAKRTFDAAKLDPSVRARQASATAESNCLRDSGQHLRAYNASEKHAEDNVVRSATMTAFWADGANKQRMRDLHTLKFSDAFMSAVTAHVAAHPTANSDEVARYVNGESTLLAELNREAFKPVTRVCRHSMLRAYRQYGFSGFLEFKQASIAHNHKVVSVERLTEREDTYTLTVEGAHTFGLTAGIFVCNSPHEDYWFPVTGGKDSTRIDSVAGSDFSAIDSIEYFRTKLVAAIKVPKRFLGLEEGNGRLLSQDDVRFARTVMRLQRAIRNGYKQVARLDLAILGIDPDAQEFEAKMTVPSYIFELAQIEVRNAQGALAQLLDPYMPKEWIVQNVFGFSEDEAIWIVDEKRRELKKDMRSNAETEASIMQDYPEISGAPPEGELPPEEMDAEATDEYEALERKLDRLLQEQQRVSRLTEGVHDRMDHQSMTAKRAARRRRMG